MSLDSRGTTAWLLHLHHGQCAAVGEREILYVLPDRAALHPIPCAPAYAANVIIWERRIVPLMDAGLLLLDPDVGVGGTRMLTLHDVIAIVAYTDAHGETGVGALLLRQVPERVQVSDDWAHDLPAALETSSRYVAACFAHPQHGIVPILDLVTLFSVPNPTPSAGTARFYSGPVDNIEEHRE
jgi:chemotaxis signal transduction protein